LGERGDTGLTEKDFHDILGGITLREESAIRGDVTAMMDHAAFAFVVIFLCCKPDKSFVKRPDRGAG